MAAINHTMAVSRKHRRTYGSWVTWPREQLLDTRICDLGLTINKSALKTPLAQLYRELEHRGFIFRPHIWISDEWFSPDGIPGFAVPFFLAHPKLKRLETDMMMDAEGGNRQWCMQLMRHETAHALLNAYKLDHRSDWKKVFGRPNARYPDSYLPKPYSKSFVVHLPNWYAQAHPHEDWAETFAVWLRPNSDWRRRYHKWPALKKLEYIDQLMKEIRQAKPRLRNRNTDRPVEKLRLTLREYYVEKVARYGSNSPEFFDRDLTRLFSNALEHSGHEKASHYIRRERRQIVQIVERWTGEYRYRINEVLQEMIERSDELRLRVTSDDLSLRPDICACVTMIVMNKLFSDGFHVSL